MNPQRLYFALDLKDDPALIAEYVQWHERENAWPEITQSILDAGIVNMEIYLTGNRLFMVMEVNEDFNPQAKAEADAHNPAVQKWETLMNQFQQPLSWAKPGEKWVPMNCIFTLAN
jgi:L-rhamnose mutarotase